MLTFLLADSFTEAFKKGNSAKPFLFVKTLPSNRILEYELPSIVIWLNS